MKQFRDSALTLVVAALTGCASNRAMEVGDLPADQILNEGQVDQPARLIDCGDFQQQEPNLEKGFLIVTVPLVVGSDGRVRRVGTPRATRAGRAQAVLDRAASLARSCVFEPAKLEGRLVTVRAEVQLRMDLSGAA